MEDKYLKTHEFIQNRWKDGLRTKSNPDYPLPYPFQPPCVDGSFQCLFYWDTFFTNRGMILDGHTDWAKYNTDNLLFLLNRYGFVPNSNSYPGVKHNSQPPFLHLMVKDIYEQTKDKIWLGKAYTLLKKEYQFWMTKRITKTGLNRYYHHPKTNKEKIEFYEYVTTRIPQLDKEAPDEVRAVMGSHLNADCEAGLDFTPRFCIQGGNIIPIDLNCNLYLMEGYLATLAKMFEPELESYFLDQQKERKNKIYEYCYNDADGLFYDYNFEKEELQQTDFNFTGQFWPYFSGVNKDKEACLRLLKNLEYQYGIAATSPHPYPYEFQAAYPFSWPYDNFFAFNALKELELVEDAIRVSLKYMTNCANQFIASNHLWETASAIVDTVAEKNEYPNTEMLGWTAGVYQMMFDYVKKHQQ